MGDKKDNDEVPGKAPRPPEPTRPDPSFSEKRGATEATDRHKLGTPDRRLESSSPPRQPSASSIRTRARTAASRPVLTPCHFLRSVTIPRAKGI
jgi:hypothetical protein